MRQSGAFAGTGSPAAVVSTLVQRRPRRVAVLLSLIAMLSLADLLFTLTYLQGIGMSEMNPIARVVIQHNSPALLAMWKLATVAFACALLWWLRRKGSAEIGAWVGLAVLSGLTAWWVVYVHELPQYAQELTAAAGRLDCPHWVSLTN
jgi:Domain of unknown function (DUF5658)